MKDIVLFGIQGSGKGTQAALLQQSFAEQISYFSSGEIFRALKSYPNAIGDFLSNKLDRGYLISDEVTIAMFHFYYSTILDEGKTMLLDGYPRTLNQLVNLVQVCLEHKRQIVGVYFELDRNTAKQRMLDRGRNDDTPEAVDKRLDLFFEKTLPNIELFERFFPVIRIDASPSIEQVHEQVKSILIEKTI